MKKLLLLLGSIACTLPVFADFGIYASAVYLQVNGQSAFYNCLAPGNGQSIGNSSFLGSSLGDFSASGAQLVLVGAELKTYKGAGDNVCSGTLYYTVYAKNQRPQSPVFLPIGLGFYADCSDPNCGSFPNAFSAAKGGGCCTPGDQKWQNPGGGNGGGANGNIDLTQRTAGEYSLELYYQCSGQDGGNGCTATKYDGNNNNPSNYSASFTISPSLPLKFGHISVWANAGSNQILWSTLSESNADRFFIERSANGSQFTEIGNIAPSRSNGLAQPYSYQDLHPLSGKNYYRIRLREQNGVNLYSPVAIADASFKNRKAFVYPNPANALVQFYLPLGNSSLQVYESTGKKVFEGRQTGQYLSINCSQWAPGSYFASIISGNTHSSIPFIISH